MLPATDVGSTLRVLVLENAVVLVHELVTKTRYDLSIVAVAPTIV